MRAVRTASRVSVTTASLERQVISSLPLEHQRLVLGVVELSTPRDSMPFGSRVVEERARRTRSASRQEACEFAVTPAEQTRVDRSGRRRSAIVAAAAGRGADAIVTVLVVELPQPATINAAITAPTARDLRVIARQSYAYVRRSPRMDSGGERSIH